MEILWPNSLFLLGLVPLVLAAYILILRRRRRYSVRYSSLALVREAIPHTAWLRRHLPFALFLLAVSSLVMALSRPAASVVVPSGKATIILTLDVSRSMCSTDIPPNRLKAAKAAVLSFIDRQDANTQIGIVAFAGFAAIVQPPTSDQELLRTAVTNLSTARRTAVGSGILESLDAIAEVNPEVVPSNSSPGSDIQLAPITEGEYAPHIIVVLSDGASNQGPNPLNAAKKASERGVRVYTIGYGSEDGAPMNCGEGVEDSVLRGGGQGFGGRQSAGGGGFGGRFRRGIDEETLMGIAEMTGGEYFSATSAGELHDVFKKLPTYLITKEENQEISVLFSAFGLLLAGAAILLSLVWHPFP